MVARNWPQHRQNCDDMGDRSSASTSSQATSHPMTSRSSTCSRKSDSRRPPESPSDAVRRLVEELTNDGLSAEDMKTFSLYLLYKKNGFSIEETINQLCQSRNAIAESLVIPALNDSARKRKQSGDSSTEVEESYVTQTLRPKKSVKSKKSLPQTFSLNSKEKSVFTPNDQFSKKSDDIAIENSNGKTTITNSL